MDITEYLRDPCGTLSVPYRKAKTLEVPDSVKIIHCRDWTGQYTEFHRYFRVKHSLEHLDPVDFELRNTRYAC